MSVRLDRCQCGGEVVETRLGRTGHGPLTQLRCLKCKVTFYIEREAWKRRKRVSAA